VGQEKGSVVKVWAGMKSEFFTDADKFEVKPLYAISATQQSMF
jgi:hypothetical protein